MKPATLAFLLAATLTWPGWHRSLGAEQTTWKLDFGGEAASGYTAVQPGSAFTNEAGFGFEEGSPAKAVVRGGVDKLHDGFVTSVQPFLFSVAVPEGVHRVTATFGDAQDTSLATVKAEARRLILEKVEIAQRTFETRSFLVTVKRPEIPGGGKVALKEPELAGHRDWEPEGN